MGKVVVYLQARQERELESKGLDPKEWVKEVVKKALDEALTTRESQTIVRSNRTSGEVQTQEGAQ